MNERKSFTDLTYDLTGILPEWVEQYKDLDIPLPTNGELMVLMHIEAAETIPVLLEQHCVSILMHDETCTPAFAAEQTVKLIEAVSEWNDKIVPSGQAAGRKFSSMKTIMEVLRQIGTGTIVGRAKRNDLLVEGTQTLMALKQAEKVS